MSHFENPMSFEEAVEVFHLHENFTGKPSEKHSRLAAGVWVLQDSHGAVLARVWPDGSILSGRLFAEMQFRG
jgi:hypothetical protein